MLHTLQDMLAPPVLARLTLLINHVLGSEAVATERLQPHAGRRVELRLTGWPSLLPPPPVLAWRITPAGLLEFCGPQPEGNTDPVDLVIGLDASNPALLGARMLAGDVPPLQIDGDAQLAGDINWLSQNLRWDMAADLERFFGPAVAQQLARLGTAMASALRGAVRGAQGLSERWRSRSSA